MKFVYAARDLAEAHLVRDLLDRAGIAAHVFNENAAAAIGLVPVSAGQPQVWVAQPHQEAHAARVVADFQNRAASAETWQCAACGETCPAEFETCWRCGALAS